MRNNYGPTFGEKTSCFLCDFWWLILIILVLIISGGLVARHYLTPEPQPTATPTSTSTQRPQPSVTPSSTNTQQPQSTSTPSEVVLGTGDIQITLRWENLNDLDLWVIDPDGFTIYYGQPLSPSKGRLDVDTNLGCTGNITPHGVENVFWPKDESPTGNYKIYVDLFATCDPTIVLTDFTVTVLNKGSEHTYQGTVSPQNRNVLVIEFENG